jgi:CO/xanthine dehydrogenase FAD-binding subunit
MEYRYASTIEEACRLVENGFSPIAGGTEINLKHGAGPLVDIDGIGMNYIEDRGDSIAIGATATIAQIERSSLLREYNALTIAAVGFTQSVKHLATIGGNIAESVASADTAPPLLVFDAEAVLASLTGERIVRVESLFAGLRKNALRRGEIIKEFLLPRFDGRSYFRKVGRTEDDLAVTSMAISVSGDVRIALGSAASVPMRARNAEKALSSGMGAARDALLSETSPRDSMRAARDYRERLETALLEECLREVGL